MKKSTLVLFGFMLGCGGCATWLALAQDEPTRVAVASPALPPQLEEVLVATHKLSSGSVVQASDLDWQGWPRNTALRGLIRKSEAPAAMDEFKDSVVRSALLAGEPIRREKLFKSGNAGDLSAILAPGHSAVAITIESGGATADGASILPNDRVDVIRVTREKAAKILVADVRVLSIGQKAPDKRGQTGATATLELDPHQAETVILAQRAGQLSLAPHTMRDAQRSAPVAALEGKQDRAITIVRASAIGPSSGR